MAGRLYLDKIASWFTSFGLYFPCKYIRIQNYNHTFKCTSHFIFFIKWGHIWLGNLILKNLDDILARFFTRLISHLKQKQESAPPSRPPQP